MIHGRIAPLSPTGLMLAKAPFFQLSIFQHLREAQSWSLLQEDVAHAARQIKLFTKLQDLSDLIHLAVGRYLQGYPNLLELPQTTIGDHSPASITPSSSRSFTRIGDHSPASITPSSSRSFTRVEAVSSVCSFHQLY